MNDNNKSKFYHVLFVCHGSILRSSGKAYNINDFSAKQGAYYTTNIPFWEEL